MRRLRFVRRPIRPRWWGREPGGRYLAGLGSAILPGLGQLVAGRPRLALLFLLPLVAAFAVLGYHAATTARLALLAELASPTSLAALLLLQAAVLILRLASIAAALLDRRWPALRRRDALPVALLCALAILPQAYLGYVTNAARETAGTIFQTPDVRSAARPTPLASGAGSADQPLASATPSPGGAPAQRITVLLIGTDYEPGRSTSLTDTLIVASFDPVGRTVSMVSVPRDMVDVPLPDGTVFQPKINSLLTYAQLFPSDYPSPGGDPHRLLQDALGSLLGVRIDYYAQVNLPGFVALVNAVGGIDVDVAHGICDPSYRDYGLQGFLITAGRHHLDGAHALGYARVRKAYGESDFTRAARQQEVVVALKDAVERGGFLRDPLGFLSALRQTVSTNLPPEMLPALVAQADAVDRNAVFRAVIQPPLVHSSPVPDPRGSIQLPDLAAIRALGAHLFPPPGTAPDPSYAMSGSRPTATAAPESALDGSPAPPTGPSTPAPGLPADDAAPGRAPICPAPPTPAPTRTATPSRAAPPSNLGTVSPGPSGPASGPAPTPGSSPAAIATPPSPSAAAPSPGPVSHLAATPAAGATPGAP